MLGTCPEVSIYAVHVLEKTKKLIKEADRLGKKVTKALLKYQGVEIPVEKELADLHSILRTYMALSGEIQELPNNIQDTLVLAEQIEEKFNEMVANQEISRATVFARNKDGKPGISPHLLLGNIRDILKACLNGGDKSIFKYKTSCNEAMALDVKWVEDFMPASNEIMMKDDKRLLCERPLRYTTPQGLTQSCIAQSEQFDKGTEFQVTLRVRKGSVMDSLENLEKVLTLGKNMGLGAWRSSNNRGSYTYKISHLPDYIETWAGKEDGWK